MAVQVLHVPASVPAEELRDLFGQLGPVTSIVMTYDPARKESDALVVYERAAAASADEAVDLFDSYPLHGSLLEVQLVQSVHQYTAQLTASLSQQTAASADAVATPPGAHYASLEAEMRDLQLHLQQHASELKQPTQAAPQQQAEHNSGWEEGWQSIASAPRRRPQHAPEAAAAGPASSTSSGGAGAGSAAEAPPNRGLWIGWIDLQVTSADLVRALSRFGPVTLEHMQPAARPAYDKQRYQWGIVQFKHLEHAMKAMNAWKKQVVPGISTVPLKVTYYNKQDHK